MNKKGKAIGSALDRYLAYPLFFDLCMVVCVWLMSKHLNFIPFSLVDKSNQIDILPNIIGTNVSLAGFILAALTIIVTFKSNLKAKGIEDSDSPLEMILTSRHYKSIVKVFKQAIIEFTICLTFLLIVWASSDNLSIWTINRVVVTGIILTSTTIFRSLYVLFMILKMDDKKP
jgi:hypothetical protein